MIKIKAEDAKLFYILSTKIKLTILEKYMQNGFGRGVYRQQLATSRCIGPVTCKTTKN
jgi:hypothetical protein